MNRNNGFTIVELLVSLTLLLIISIFVASRLVDVDKNSKEKLYNSKISIILSSAYKYGSDHIDSLSNTCTYVSIAKLIENGYLVGDSENKLEMINPFDNESMNYLLVCIKYENGDIKTNMK